MSFCLFFSSIALPRCVVTAGSLVRAGYFGKGLYVSTHAEYACDKECIKSVE